MPLPAASETTIVMGREGESSALAGGPATKTSTTVQSKVQCAFKVMTPSPFPEFCDMTTGRQIWEAQSSGEVGIAARRANHFRLSESKSQDPEQKIFLGISLYRKQSSVYRNIHPVPLRG